MKRAKAFLKQFPKIDIGYNYNTPICEALKRNDEPMSQWLWVILKKKPDMCSVFEYVSDGNLLKWIMEHNKVYEP